MAGGSLAKRLGRGLRRALRVAGRPVRRAGAAGRGGLVIQPYRGYGSRHELFVMGRVFRQPGGAPGARGRSALHDLADLGRRIARWGVGGVAVAARHGGARTRVVTDRAGYFRVRLRPAAPPPEDRLWHGVELALPDAGPDAPRAWGQVFVPPRRCRRVVISDIDDTIMETGVAHKARMLWRLFVAPAESRTVFPGVAALYRALHRGASGDECNPMLYVSRGPWSIYEMLERFFEIHRIPVGPILFLREWGLTLQHPLPRRAEGHKDALLRDMLARYRDLPFVLVGDSGQHDPEIYARAVREHPGRVEAVYIRRVALDPERDRAIADLADAVRREGSSLLLADDSFAMAEDAAARGLIAPDALPAVLAQREAPAP